jgi:hypothetical protein
MPKLFIDFMESVRILLQFGNIKLRGVLQWGIAKQNIETLGEGASSMGRSKKDNGAELVCYMSICGVIYAENTCFLDYQATH